MQLHVLVIGLALPLRARRAKLTCPPDSFSSKTNTSDQIYESHNLNKLKKFLTDNNILQIIFKPVANRSGRYNTTIPSIPTPLLYTIQVVAAPMLLSFDPHIADYHFGFPDSQAIVYSTPTAWPIFTGCHGLDINMPFILHNLNFWKYHMVREVENTLFNAFADLDDDERPRWWSTQPKQGEHALGKRWKGSYAFVDREDIDTMRRGLSDDADPIQDQFAGEDACFSFQNMKLELADEGKELPWPQMFEKELRSLTPAATRARTRAQKRCATPDAIANFKPQSFRFDGEGLDVAEQFFASGWLNPLPPQSGIPGWRRMTMMKYFEHEFDAGVIDPEGLWAYEGVVLPGGQIMLGRWWSVDDGVDGQYSGPFILWCVDGPKYEDAAETKVGKEEFEDVGRP